MVTPEVRQPETELEKRLINEDTIFTGEDTELSEKVKKTLGYDGIIAFEYDVEKAIFADSNHPEYLLQQCLGLGQYAFFNPNNKRDMYFRLDVRSRIERFFGGKFKDNIIGIVIKDISDQVYKPFDIPIGLPEKKANLDICTGKATAKVLGHVFYKA